MIEKKTLKNLISDLNSELKALDKKYSLIIMGASALIALDYTDRGTMDVDLIQPEIDQDLLKASRNVADKWGLSYNWLNSSARVFLNELPKDWEKRAKEYSKKSHLIVKTLGRKDLIFSKLFAAIERPQKDFDDLLSLNPSAKEIQTAKKELLKNKRSQLFIDRMDRISKKLKKEISREKRDHEK